MIVFYDNWSYVTKNNALSGGDLTISTEPMGVALPTGHIRVTRVQEQGTGMISLKIHRMVCETILREITWN